MTEPIAQDALRRLGAELTARKWIARVRGDGGDAVLHVANPDAGKMSEDIACRVGDGRWSFYWSWGQVIGPATEVSEVADRIQFVLVSRRRVARREAARTVPAPELQPHVAESLTSACGGWLVIWSPWRRTYTAFGAATSERTIIDEPTVHGLLDRIDQVEAALTRATAGPASHRRSPLPRLVGPPHVLRW